MLFSDPTYQLPQIEALRAVKVMDTGRTLPMALDGVDKNTGQKDQFVVKFLNANNKNPSSPAKELIASFIGLELELPIVTPAIINISKEFVDSIYGRTGFSLASQCIGENFGSRYRPGFEELLVGQKFSGKMEADAIRIYGFDMFITNADRGHQKNNVHTNGEEFLIFDHEMGFSYISMIFNRNPTPWIFDENDKINIPKHVFYSYLKNKEQDFTTFASDLQRIDDSFWEKVETLLPAAWNTSEVGEIRDYLTEIVKHRDEFADQLTQTLL
jgi:hypothetical protein